MEGNGRSPAKCTRFAFYALGNDAFGVAESTDHVAHSPMEVHSRTCAYMRAHPPKRKHAGGSEGARERADDGS